MDASRIQCLIFDLDGTLVDSEPLCAQAYLDILPDLSLSVDALNEWFRGWKFADTVDELQTLLKRTLPVTFEAKYRQRVERLFQSRLETFEGVHAALNALSLPMCIASSGPQKKIISSLSITQLTHFFAPNIFSAYDINVWKPEPDLFLHAAQKMGFRAANCLVIEDSDVGLCAAKAAGMDCLYFDPEQSSQTNTKTFHRYAALPQLIAKIS